MDTGAIQNVYNILLEYFSEQEHFMDVFNHLGGADGRISARGTAPAFGGWRAYYKHYLTQANEAYGNSYEYAKPAWDNQQDTLKRAMNVIAPATILIHGRSCAPLPGAAGGAAGGGVAAGDLLFQVGGGEYEDAIAEKLIELYEFYSTPGENEHYKSSVTAGLEEKIQGGFTDTDPVTRAAEIASILEEMSIDGDETVGDIYRINVSSIRDAADAVARGEHTSAGFATDVLAFIFLHDSAMFTMEILSPATRAKFLDAVVYLLEPSSNLIVRQLEANAKLAGSNMQKQLAISEALRRRRTELGAYNSIAPVVSSEKKPRILTVAGLPPQLLGGTSQEVLLTASPSLRGGARRRRRTRRRGSRAAARRARTFRRRK